MTTTAALVTACREDYLTTGAASQRTRLSGSLATASGTSSVTVGDASAIGTGTRFSIGFEDFHAWSVAGSVVTAQRGDYGSSAFTHADDSIVTIEPEFSDAKILRSLQATMEQLRQEPWLFRVAHLDYAAPHTGEFVLGPAPDASAEVGYDGVLEVLIATDEETEPWARVPWDVVQRADADGSDALVTVPDARYYNRDVRIIRRQALGQITPTGTDVETETGVLNTDLIAVGAALRLGAGRPLRRTSLHAQGDSRRANEVAAFSTGNATRELERRYKTLLQAEQIRLKKQYPFRRYQ